MLRSLTTCIDSMVLKGKRKKSPSPPTLAGSGTAIRSTSNCCRARPSRTGGNRSRSVRRAFTAGAGRRNRVRIDPRSIGQLQRGQIHLHAGVRDRHIEKTATAIGGPEERAELVTDPERAIACDLDGFRIEVEASEYPRRRVELMTRCRRATSRDTPADSRTDVRISRHGKSTQRAVVLIGPIHRAQFQRTPQTTSPGRRKLRRQGVPTRRDEGGHVDDQPNDQVTDQPTSQQSRRGFIALTGAGAAGLAGAAVLAHAGAPGRHQRPPCRGTPPSRSSRTSATPMPAKSSSTSANATSS